MFDFDTVDFDSIEAKRVPREFVTAGEHLVNIVAVEVRETQNGKTVAIIEADVVSSSYYNTGEGVKQMFALKNDLAWRIKQNMGLLKALLIAAFPEKTPNAALLKESLPMAGEGSSCLVNKQIKIIARNKTSQNGKDYLDFSYAASNGEAIEKSPAMTSEEVTQQLDNTFGASPSTTSTTPTTPVTTEEIPDFDV